MEQLSVKLGLKLSFKKFNAHLGSETARKFKSSKEVMLDASMAVAVAWLPWWWWWWLPWWLWLPWSLWSFFSLFLKNWAIPSLFFFIFVLSTQLTVNKCSIWVCRWLDSNWGSLVSEATALTLSHNHCPRRDLCWFWSEVENIFCCFLHSN